MDGLRRRAARTFSSLSTRNYRLFFLGMAVSATGQWMQLVAQGWLVLQLGGGGFELGAVTALQFTPVLVGGAWGGVLADRMDKRRLVVRTQVAAAVLALVLGVATATEVVTLPVVYVLAFLLGCVNAVDNPARRSFLPELVAEDEVTNAVGLNTAMFTSSRVVGPALAGAVIGAFGTAVCFFANAASFGAVLLALSRLDPDELRRARPAPRTPGQVREGLRYAWSTPAIRLPLLMTAVISTFAFEYQVVLPLLAATVFEGGAGTYGLLFAVVSVGSLTGALFTAGGGLPARTTLLTTAAGFGVAMLLAAGAPTLLTELVVLVPMGAAGAAFVAASNAILQAEVRPELRGRVMALYAVVFLGSTPIGGPIVGAVAERFGARSGFVVGGVATLLTVAVLVVPVFSARQATRRVAARAQNGQPSYAPAGRR